MSVLIKGMQMPKNCAECHLGEYEDSEWFSCSLMDMAYRHMAQCDRLDDCPLVELPEKHGRLIDADAFFSRLSVDDYMFSFHVDGVFVDVTKINDVLRHQPTVIEAEGEDRLRSIIQDMGDEG